MPDFLFSDYRSPKEHVGLLKEKCLLFKHCQYFGTYVKLYAKSPKKVRKHTAEFFDSPKYVSTLECIKIFNSLRHLRNLCMHHGKLIGESLRISPVLWKGLDPKFSNSLANHLAWMTHLQKSTRSKNSFQKELTEIIKALNTPDLPRSVHLWLPTQ
jgi:abortive infection bacteriophage resistance protein